MDELSEYHRQLIAEIQGDADAMGLITSEAFLDKIADVLDEAGEVSSLSQCYFEGKHGSKAVQVDAYAWDPTDEEGVLSVVICDFAVAEEPQSIDKTEVSRQLKRLVEFLVAAKTREFRENLEETSNGFVLSDLIARAWKQIDKIKLILVTNRVNKSRTDAQPVGAIGAFQSHRTYGTCRASIALFPQGRRAKTWLLILPRPLANQSRSSRLRMMALLWRATLLSYRECSSRKSTRSGAHGCSKPMCAASSRHETRSIEVFATRSATIRTCSSRTTMALLRPPNLSKLRTWVTASCSCQQATSRS